MTKQELIERSRALAVAHNAALSALVVPARAAANAMKDAKMDRSAGPLLEALFALDATTQEIADFVKGNMDGIAEAYLDALFKDKRGGS
jgi:hypothetical protein